MNARERFMNTIFGKPTDRLFRYDCGAWNETVDLWKESGDLPEDFIQDGDFMHCNWFRHFGFDVMYRIPLHTGGTDSPFYPRMEKEILEKGIDWDIVRDENGIVQKAFHVHTGLASIPQFISFPVETRGDWEKIKEKHICPEMIEEVLSERLDEVTEVCADDRDFPVELNLCGAYAFPRNLMGNVNFSYALYDEPELVDDIMDTWLMINKEIARILYMRTQFDNLFLWEDMCYRNGPLVSPDHWRRYMLPRYTEYIDYCKGLGVKSIMVDTDGDCRKMIPLYLESGVNVMQPFEVQSGMDVVEVYKQYGDRLAIQGGIDKRALFIDREAIKKEVDRVMAVYLDGGKLIPSLDHLLPPNISYENYMYYIECVRSYE